ncbi:MAG: hypothetical protein Q9170_001785 [Blastenia crenularia]
MPMIYKRFTEKSAEEWRQIYKGLQLLEFLIKNGSERVIDDARSHMSLLKMLRQFHFIDQNGKDQGVNVRNRSKELTELLSDVDRIRGERKKARANRNKFGGVEGGAMSGGLSSGSRYGGFGSESAGYGGYSGGVYGDGGGFGGATSEFQDSSSRRDKFEEYDEYDEVASPARRKPESSSLGVRRDTQKPPPPKKKEPEVDILSFDADDIPPKTPPKDIATNGKRTASNPMDDGSASLQSGAAGEEDDFDDFQSATPSNQAPTPSIPGLSLPSNPPISIPSPTPLAAPKPVSGTQGANLNDLVGFNSISPTPSTTGITSPQASTFTTSPPPAPNAFTSPPPHSIQQQQQPVRSSGYRAAQPNYYTSVQVQSSATPSSSQSKPSLTSPSPSYPSTNKPSTGAKSSGDAFSSLWSTASSSAGIKKTNTAGSNAGPNLASMAKEKASQGIWGANATPAPMGSASKMIEGKGQRLRDDLLRYLIESYLLAPIVLVRFAGTRSGSYKASSHLFQSWQHAMSGHSGTFSPVSANGSEWSGISRYQNLEPSNYSSQPSHPRGNLATPPVSGSSTGIQGRLSNGMNRPPNAAPGNPSPPNSVARSSYGTSLSDHQRRKTLMMEEALSQHYSILKRYLASSLRDEKGNVRLNRARDKLLRLSPVQFQELSTDVYDELLRRQSAAGQQTNGPGQVSSYLQPRDNFHPKRNQARSKLSSLPPPRFRDLATDVFYELERRFPRFTGANVSRSGSPAPSIRGPPSRTGTPNGMRPGSRGQGPPGPGPGYGPPRNASLGSQVMAGLGIPGVGGPEDAYGRPTAKTFQSSTIIPNKSTLVEDDDDQTGPEDNDDGRSEFSRRRRDTGNTQRSVMMVNERDRKAITDLEAQIGDLQGKLERLESTVKDRDTEIDELRQAEDGKDQANREWANMRDSLESKLVGAQNLNKSLQSEIERVKSDQMTTERQLRSELDQMTRRGESGESEWKTRYEGLHKAHQDLQNELKQQQVTTGEVKQEAAGFLSEMKMLSERSNQTWEREEALMHQNQRLEEQMDEWKSRYARAKAQLRTLRTSSAPLQQADIKQLAKASNLIQEDGLVQDVHVTGFQVAIDELLRNARTDGPESVLVQVRQVVIAVRQITRDIGESSKEDAGPKTVQLKVKVSATANNLITASKNFAASKGLSPISLLDAAASHLTTAMVELIRIAKIHPSAEGDFDAEEEDNSIIAESPAAYYGIHHDRMSYGGESIYSSPSSPRPRNAFDDPVQMKQPYHQRNVSSRDGPPNGVKAPLQTKLGFGIREQEDEIEELKASQSPANPIRSY